MAKRSKHVKPEHREILTAEVLASKRISPNFVRVTLGGTGLANFTAMGFDQWFRLFMPGRDGSLKLPTSSTNLGWFAQYLMMGKEHRPLARNYTVRDYRAAGFGEFGSTAEIDVDFVSHGDGSPASAWANNATPGCQVGLLDEGITYQAPDHSDWTLLVGDERAARHRGRAAVAAARGEGRGVHRDSVRRGPAGTGRTRGRAGELAGPHGRARGGRGAGRGGGATGGTARHGRLRLHRGRAEIGRGVRRHLAQEREIPKADITFTGYWRVGKSQG